MHTYAELLESLALHPADPCQRFVGRDGVVARQAGDVLAAARTRAGQLLALGLTKGERVGLVVTNPADFLPLMHGCLLQGLVAVPMYPPPLFGRTEPYRASVARILETARARALVVDDALVARLGPLPVETMLGVGALQGSRAAARPSIHPEDLALLQFTSGSTGLPKGVMISHGALLANAQAIMVGGLSASGQDHGVTWLPLYHDMGLIGFGLAPLLTNTSVSFIPTARFISNPAIWLQTIDATRATITFAPNFAYALATRRVAPEGLDLGSMRMWGCGAEPISATTLEAFERRFATAGVRPGQISPCYGLAEATLAVTFTLPSATRRVDEIDADAWEQRGEAVGPRGGRTLRFASCGPALPQHEVAVVDTEGLELGDRRAGEIVVRGPSLGGGYFELPEESAAVFRADGLHTGDKGYLVNGELFVAGRLKDVVNVNGRNYDPETIERIAGAVSGVRLAVAVNYHDDEGERLAILFEHAGERTEAAKEGIRAAIASDLGVQVDSIRAVSPGSLPRTTSGKLRRNATRTLLDALRRSE